MHIWMKQVHTYVFLFCMKFENIFIHNILKNTACAVACDRSGQWMYIDVKKFS